MLSSTPNLTKPFSFYDFLTRPVHWHLQISMYINSPGGIVTAGMAVYDTMQVR